MLYLKALVLFVFILVGLGRQSDSHNMRTIDRVSVSWRNVSELAQQTSAFETLTCRSQNLILDMTSRASAFTKDAGPMTEEQKVICAKVGPLGLARELGNGSRARKMMATVATPSIVSGTSMSLAANWLFSRRCCVSRS